MSTAAEDVALFNESMRFPDEVEQAIAEARALTRPINQSQGHMNGNE